MHDRQGWGEQSGGAKLAPESQSKMPKPCVCDFKERAARGSILMRKAGEAEETDASADENGEMAILLVACPVKTQE